MARPQKPINEELVEKLARLGCTGEEIGFVVGVDKSTISRRFATIVAKGGNRLKISIRRMQLKTARKGNVAMQIWLGKQYLGQAEKSEQVNLGALYQDPRLNAKAAPPKGKGEGMSRILSVDGDGQE